MIIKLILCGSQNLVNIFFKGTTWREEPHLSRKALFLDVLDFRDVRVRHEFVTRRKGQHAILPARCLAQGEVFGGKRSDQPTSQHR